MNLFGNLFATKVPQLGRASGNPRPSNQGNPLPSSNQLQSQFNAKIQQIRTIISQLNNNRASQKSFNDSVRDQLAGFTKQLSTVIIPAVKNLKSQIASLRNQCSALNNTIAQKQNETTQIIEKVNDEEIKNLLKQIEQLESEKQQLLDSQAIGNVEKEEIAEKLRQTDEQLRAAEQDIIDKNANMERQTQQQLAQIQQNKAEIDSLKQQKAQLEQIITDSMSIMDEIIADLNGLNVANNNDVLNNSIESVKQNIDELTQLLSGTPAMTVNPVQEPESSEEKTPSFGISPFENTPVDNPLQHVPQQPDNMLIRYPIWINGNYGGELGQGGQPDFLSINAAPLYFNELMRSLSNCSSVVCNEAREEISALMKPTEAEIIQILLDNTISINYNSGFKSTLGNDATMQEIRSFLVSRKIISSGGMKKRRMRTSKKHNKKTKKSNRKTKKQRGGWNYDNKRHRRTSRSSRSSKRRTPR